MGKRMTPELERNICAFYTSSPKTIEEVCVEFNLCRPTISKVLKNNNCYIYTKQDLYNIGVKQDFFENIDNEYKAYFLGLLIADGCIFKFCKNTMFVMLSLQERDSYMVENFAKVVGANRKVLVDKRDNSKSITISSNKMASDLSKYGVIEKKTFSTYLPMIRKDLMKHLVRGILDGDGNVGKRFTNKGNVRWQIAFCGSERLMIEIKNFLVYELDVYDIKVCKEKNIYSIRWTSKEDFLKICDYLYEGSNIYLIRKRQVFEDFLNNIY